MPTTNHGYNTPAEGAVDWDDSLNANFDSLDVDIIIRDTAANRSNYTAQNGAAFLETDTGIIYEGDGTSWNAISPELYTTEKAQDDAGAMAADGLAYDDATPSLGLDVVISGQTTLASGAAVVDTGITAVDATFILALGVDDPNADVKLAGRLFWDDSDGSYWIEIVEDGTSVGNPTANYDVVRVR